MRKMGCDAKKHRIWPTFIGVFETRNYKPSDIGGDGHGGYRAYGFGHLHGAPAQLLMRTVEDIEIELK